MGVSTYSPVGRISHTSTQTTVYVGYTTHKTHSYADLTHTYTDKPCTTQIKEDNVGEPTNTVIKSFPCSGAYKTMLGYKEKKMNSSVKDLFKATWSRMSLSGCVLCVRSLIWVPRVCGCVSACRQLCCISTMAQYVLECRTAHAKDGSLVHLLLHNCIGLYSVITAPTAEFTFFILFVCACVYKLRWQENRHWRRNIFVAF